MNPKDQVAPPQKMTQEVQKKFQIVTLANEFMLKMVEAKCYETMAPKEAVKTAFDFAQEFDDHAQDFMQPPKIMRPV